jgi:hypothetical protein
MRLSFFTLLGVFLSAPCLSGAQTQAVPAAVPNPTFTAAYPSDRAGIFVQNPDWAEISGVTPSKTKAKHGLAASLSYGAVPAVVTAEYAGLHAQTQLKSGQPIICLCHLISLPGDPVIVKLHPKKEIRELDGGKMVVYPVFGGSKQADANKSDLIPVDVSHPDPQVWLVRPQSELPAGEYALMLGTQNVNIFPFTVTGGSAAAESSKQK